LQTRDTGSGNSRKPHCGLRRRSSKKSAVYDWYTHLQTTKSYILAYDKRRRRQTTSKNDENVTEVRTTLTPDRRVTTEQTVNEIAISSGWILSIMKDATVASV